jgi:ABC-2 type transport system permease protein
MSTMTQTAPRRSTGPSRAGFGDAVASEWVKIRTVRSTMWSLLAMVVVSVGLTAVIAGVNASQIANGSNNTHPDELIIVGLFFGQITALVLGSLVMSAEYSTGMIRASLSAVPHRVRLLCAKALVLAIVIFVIGTVTSFACYGVSETFLSAKHIGVPLSQPGVMRAVIGGGLYLTVLALFGFALAALMRHTAAAITTGLGFIFVIDNVAGLLPGGWGHWIYKLLPGNAGSQVLMVTNRNGDPHLGPWSGFAVFVIEIAVLFIAAAVLFRERDA